MVQTAPEPTENTLRKKRQILRAASRVFRQRGLHAAGMRDIAAEMGMHVGNLYYYFESKQDLLAFCQADTLSGLLEMAAEIDALDLPADAALARLIRDHVTLLNEGTPGSLAHLEVEALEGPFRDPILEQRERYESAIRRIIDRGVERGVFRPCDSKVATMAILGALNWTVKWYRPEGGKPAESIGEEFAAHLVGGLQVGGATLDPMALDPATADVLEAEAAESRP